MSRPWFTCLIVSAFGGLSGAAAAEAPRSAGPAIELPPMMVEETVASAPWLHTSAGGAEFLSRCSSSTTRDFVSAWVAKMQLVRVLVPEEFLARTDAPTLIVLYSQGLEQTVSAEIQRELQSDQKRDGDRVNIAPNMRLADRDMHASIVYIDETQFSGAGLSISPGHVHFMLRGRVPELPAWLLDGVVSVWQGADFVLDPITLRPFPGATDPARPRALLPAAELFAGAAARAGENRHPRHLEARHATQEIFFRWAAVSGPATRAAFWKVAALSAEGPVTEEAFEGVFGFDFAELRDRLSDYLPKAAGETAFIRPGTLPPLPDFELERATPGQVARIRGEWERLAIGHVKRRLPQVAEPYIAQARRTLRRAYDAGDRDPRLLATMGLCEIDAGNDAGARPYLEPAVAGGVARPRAYHELARLRFAELRRDAPESKLFPFAEIAPVLQPLQRGITQSPPLPESFQLLAEAWARCEISPTANEFAELRLGTRLFPRRPPVAHAVAVVLARHGHHAEATAVLDACAGHSADDATEAAIARLRVELSRSPASR
ncbi:MAG: hypothetical protein JNL39_08780 [Opitutaceae bacterium]|nr:hypothetical protein [Opitutaceae bacterium]